VMRPLDGEGATQVLLMGHRRLRITGMVSCYSLAEIFYLQFTYNLCRLSILLFLLLHSIDFVVIVRVT
jgi:hypothetical protein